MSASHRRITVIRAGALGDVLLTLPAIHTLRAQYPRARIRVVGYPGVWEVAGTLVNEILPIDDPLFAGLCVPQPSTALCALLQESDILIAWTTRALSPSFYDQDIPVIHASPFPPPGVHAAAWLLQTLTTGASRAAFARSPHPTPCMPQQERSRAALARPPSPAPCMPPPAEAPSPNSLLLTPDERRRGSKALAELGLDHPVLLHPGAGAAWKRWPAARFAALATEVASTNNPVALIVGPADEQALTEIESLGAGRFPVIREPSPRRLAGMLAAARLFVGNDSGVTHLAAMAGASTVALFGPTDPTSWAPLGDVSVLRACRRSTTTQGEIRVCGDPACMDGLFLDEVRAEIQRRLHVDVQNRVENRPLHR